MFLPRLGTISRSEMLYVKHDTKRRQGHRQPDYLKHEQINKNVSRRIYHFKVRVTLTFKSGILCEPLNGAVQRLVDVQ